MFLTLRDGHNDRYPSERWLKLAAEAWKKSGQLKDLEARCEMETIARGYERLAEFSKRSLSERKAD